MQKYSIVFLIADGKKNFKHRIINAADQDAAINIFFKEEMIQHYSDNEQGFFYFKDDFFDKNDPSGSILLCE